MLPVARLSVRTLLRGKHDTKYDTREDPTGRLRLTLRRRLAKQLRLLDRRHTLLHEVPLVVDDADVALREVDDRLVRDFPEVLRDLGDEACGILDVSMTWCG